jgi:acetyl esterase/lipase
MQMYQAYQAAAVERPGLLPAPSPELLAAARMSWIDEVDTDTDRTSQLQAAVSACLTHMGVAHANERWCDRAERSIDIAIEGGATPIALEVDGPSHFLQDGRPDGSTLLRNRTLAAHGWRVVVVDYRVWNTLQTQQQREEYLRRVLTV